MNKILIVAFLLLSTFQLQSQCDHPDYDELMKFYEDLGGDNWTNNEGWGEDCEPCEWFGVTCNSEGHVIQIKIINDNNLKGQLSNYYFPYLLTFWINKNEIVGPIPDFTGLPNLENLYLDQNSLEGIIPNFSNLPSLKILSLWRNELIGEVPDFANFAKLERLSLNENELIGEIPDFTNLPALKSLRLSSNNLTGEIPNFTNLGKLITLAIGSNDIVGLIPDFSNLPELEFLNLNHNQHTGSIPDFSNLSKLINLFVGGSTNKLSGEIPDFSNLPNLENLYLSFNNYLTGSIPVFTNSLLLRKISLGVNSLTGEIPDFTLPYLEELWLGNNDLTEDIPSFTNCPKLRVLSLGNNNLNGIIPDFNHLPDLEVFSLRSNDLEGCYPHKNWCGIDFNFNDNPKLPYGGDYAFFCNGEPQIGAPCDDGDPLTENDVIQDDCSCGGIISSTSNQTQNELIIYPNPASDFIIIENYTRPKLIVSDVSGRNFKLNSIGNSKYDVSQLSPGLYFILATEQKAKNTVLKFIKL